ncbi:MAG: hypothetical protein J5755_06030, partial [Clostridia bacterium]|nr:hypothetical protein [Clostridia bacterium]
PLALAFFALWSLLGCLAAIAAGVTALTRKRYLSFGLAVAAFAPTYLLWQAAFDLVLWGREGDVTKVTRALVGLPWAAWLGILAVLSVAVALALWYNVRYGRTHISPVSIKVYLDRIPCGVCCWKDNGRVLFSNICMNRLCEATTDSPLLNGYHFRDAVGDEILSVDGKRWRFACRDLVLGGERVHEMIASDVTTEYAKTQALEEDKAELSRVNDELKDYTSSIDETVRRGEILQAKVNIHDEMNRLMLSTMAADSEDKETMDKIFALWSQNALLLCYEADDDRKALGRVEELAGVLKIRLVWHGSVPACLDDQRRGLIYTAAQEAIANLAKHSEAKELRIEFEETEDAVECRFVNEGGTPHDPVPFGGGLANLARLADKMGGSVEAKADGKFTLTLRFARK